MCDILEHLQGLHLPQAVLTDYILFFLMSVGYRH
jgi:hypothetical protein